VSIAAEPEARLSERHMDRAIEESLGVPLHGERAGGEASTPVL